MTQKTPFNLLQTVVYQEKCGQSQPAVRIVIAGQKKDKNKHYFTLLFPLTNPLGIDLSIEFITKKKKKSAY